MSAPVELFANHLIDTQLAEAVVSGDTLLTLRSGQGEYFPAAVAGESQFRIRVDDELLLVTHRDGDALTVERGIEGSAPSAHRDGASVRPELTAAALDRFLQLSPVRLVVSTVVGDDSEFTYIEERDDAGYVTRRAEPKGYAAANAEELRAKLRLGRAYCRTRRDQWAGLTTTAKIDTLPALIAIVANLCAVATDDLRTAGDE